MALEPENVVPLKPEPTSGPYHEPAEPNPYFKDNFLIIHINTILLPLSVLVC